MLGHCRVRAPKKGLERPTDVRHNENVEVCDDSRGMEKFKKFKFEEKKFY